jgi:hypothetical protein
VGGAGRSGGAVTEIAKSATRRMGELTGSAGMRTPPPTVGQRVGLVESTEEYMVTGWPHPKN